MSFLSLGETKEKVEIMRRYGYFSLSSIKFDENHTFIKSKLKSEADF